MHYVITCLVTRNTLLALVVLSFPFVVLVYPPVVLVYTLVVLVCPFVCSIVVSVCPLVVLVCPLEVSACPLVVLVVLSIGLFITDQNSTRVHSGYLGKKKDERNLFIITVNKSRRETD